MLIKKLLHNIYKWRPITLSSFATTKTIEYLVVQKLNLKGDFNYIYELSKSNNVDGVLRYQTLDRDCAMCCVYGFESVHISRFLFLQQKLPIYTKTIQTVTRIITSTHRSEQTEIRSNHSTLGYELLSLIYLQIVSTPY